MAAALNFQPRDHSMQSRFHRVHASGVELVETSAAGSPFRILVADDQPDVVTALRLLLKGEGFQAEGVSSPRGILEAVDRDVFDVVLMDLNYSRDTTSGREGLELLAELLRRPHAPGVVVMTAWGSIELAVEAMRRGARDFVLKPWENERLTKILREQAEASRQRRVQAVSLQARDEFGETERMTAARVQQRLFPSQAPSLATLQCAALCKQAGAVGGDYYDFLEVGPGRLGLVLADVCGKGMAAALLMANLQATLRSRFPAFVDDLPALLHDVNELFCRATQPEHYASLFLGVYDEAGRRLRYVNCGHFPPLLLRAGGGLEKLDATATVLGMFEAVTIEAGEIELHAGDLLVIYSDGAVETRGEDGEEFGQTRLGEACRRHGGIAAEAIPALVAEEIAAFGRQEDDLTIVVGKVR